MEDSATLSKRTPTWQNCIHCPNLVFTTITEFESHIRNKHSVKEGSIILCQYGPNGICAGLQFGDLREAGFKYHVREYHLYSKNKAQDWDFYSSSLNLSAVLNDPNRGKQSNFFTKTWGDHFVDKIELHQSPFLPEITIHHFELYCKRVAKKYKKHCRLKESNHSKIKTSCLEEDCEVPSIFFEKSLQLHDPKIFSKVFPHLINTNDPIASIRLSQETLSTYLDIIEIKISKQVAEKSEAFFNAMLSHDTIMEDMAQAVKTVNKTRQNLNSVTENLSETPLKLISLTRVGANIHNIQELLKLMSTVQQTQPMIQLLLSTSDYVAALDLISSTQKVLSTRLTRVQAFRHLSPQLTEMKRFIHKMLNNEFQKYLVSNLNRPPDHESLCDKDKLTSIISGILRLKELDFVELLKTEAMTSMQTTIKQCVIEIISQRDSTSEVVLRGTNPDNHTSLLNSEGAIFLHKVTPRILSLFKRIVYLITLILEVTQMHDLTGGDCEELWTPEELALVESNLNTMLISLSDYCNESCANLIMNKTDSNNLPFNLTQLSELSQAVDNFSEECETIIGHSSSAMRLAIKSHAMQYIQILHAESRTLLTNSLNNERWKSSDVSSTLQSKLDKLFGNNDVNFISEKPENKYLIINKENYAVVGTVQLLINILLQYCEAIQQPHIVAQYLVHCMLELIRLFNSRCCQLVLGAGAIQSAGLKTISTSNLALVSRSLQVLLWILPKIKSLLTKSDSVEIPLNGFDNIENDLLSHKQEIEQKICLIVSDMLSSQLTGWDAKPPVPSQTFRNISKHLVKLHEALIDILPIEQIRVIYKTVHDNFKDKLREQLVKMNIVANGSPQHGVVTSELTFYLQTLKTLRVIQDSGVEDNILYDVWLN